MLLEVTFIFFFTLLLVTLLVPVGGYRKYRTYDRSRVVPAETEEEQAAEEEVGVGLTMLFFFLLLFPLLLAGNMWITPYGPAVMGVSLVPLLFFGLMLTLLIAASAPPVRRDVSRTENEETDKRKASAIFGIVFFILLVLALVALLPDINGVPQDTVVKPYP